MKAEKKKERQRASTRDLIGITAILKDGIRTGQGELVFFLLKPTNIAVLSDATTEAKVMSLADVLKGFPELEMLALNSREDYEGNKRFLAERARKETVPEIRALLMQDHFWLDTVQSQMATAREFVLVLRLIPEKQEAPTQEKKRMGKHAAGKPGGAAPTPAKQPLPLPFKRTAKASLILARLEKALRGRGFSVRLADSQEIMRLLSVYFAQNVTTERFEDFDGQRFASGQIL